MLLTNPSHKRIRTASSWVLAYPLSLTAASIPLSLSAAFQPPLLLPTLGLVLALASAALSATGPALAARVPAVLDGRTRRRIYNRLVGRPASSGTAHPDLVWPALVSLGARANRGPLHRAAWNYSLAEIACDAARHLYLDGTEDPAGVQRREYELARDELQDASDVLAELAVATLATTTLSPSAARLASELAGSSLTGTQGALTAEQITHVLAIDHPEVTVAQVDHYLTRRALVERLVREHLLMCRW